MASVCSPSGARFKSSALTLRSERKASTIPKDSLPGLKRHTVAEGRWSRKPFLTEQQHAPPTSRTSSSARLITSESALKHHLSSQHAIDIKLCMDDPRHSNLRSGYRIENKVGIQHKNTSPPPIFGTRAPEFRLNREYLQTVQQVLDMHFGHIQAAQSTGIANDAANSRIRLG